MDKLTKDYYQDFYKSCLLLLNSSPTEGRIILLASLGIDSTLDVLINDVLASWDAANEPFIN